MVLSVLGALLAARCSAKTNRFSAKWRGTEATADAAFAAADVPLKTDCTISVIGAGWSGAYFAWRLAIDSQTVKASEVCVFEANGRVGGRVDSIHGLPGFDDLAVDLGGYRFIETDLLPAQLVWKALELPTACYDWNCSADCEGANCYVIKDVYANNCGYARPIETMLARLEDAGAGVYFGYALESLKWGNTTTLGFRNGAKVVSKTVLLNVPRNSLENLDIEPALPALAELLLDRVSMTALNKVYAYYDDAWWNSKLGLMEGYFNSTTSLAPLVGRYHDGPQKCAIGRDTDGKVIYGAKFQGGNCTGAIEVYYSVEAPFYRAFMTDDLSPVTVATDDRHPLKIAVHEALMAYHANALAAVGFATSDIPLPVTVVLSNWIKDGAYAPGIGRMLATDYGKKIARNPTNGLANLFVANQDYGYKSGWANGGLLMAEKVLQSDLGVGKPAWLDDAYYEEYILQVP
ncbi:hypothetical protein CTAYLR_003068 [Chrysophaeum taylorii]|uniref:Amine oxidase domain-containing protein n=1 Tax=Chrysophaeum taylorii TaxID=2483200 RepID=A0AAD7XHS3_9STRA|nr:hypothetical protein CTAYLR_003068 [Chrysophaeum taylorii]